MSSMVCLRALFLTHCLTICRASCSTCKGSCNTACSACKEGVKIGCDFLVNAAEQPKPKKEGVPRVRSRVRISSFCLKHGKDCHPSKCQLVIAKKASGAYMANLDLSKFDNIIEMLSHGRLSAQQVRLVLQDHLPNDVHISSDDIRNVRLRALKYSLEEKPLDKVAATKILQFVPLDQNETIKMADTDSCRRKVAELRMQGTRNIQHICLLKCRNRIRKEPWP